MYEEAVEPQADVMDDMIEQGMPDIIESQDNDHDDQQVESREAIKVPLSVAQKLREKKKEVELELQWEKQRRAELENRLAAMNMPQAPQEEDNSRYESATREDLNRSQNEVVRAIEEKLWIKQNPEKFEKVNQYLPALLKQRPNLAAAINLASNRYEEAYELMDKLSPKQQIQLKQAPTPKKEAPNSPGSIPKAAALNEAVDVMSMSDSEFAAWRQNQRRRR